MPEMAEGEKFSPWETFSDLYCGLLLVFVLLFFFAIYQYIDAREKNDADTIALQESMREEQDSVLAIYKADLSEQTEAYQKKSEELENQKTALAILQVDLNDRTEQLDEKQQLINQQEDQLSEQKVQLEEQESQLNRQQELLEQQQIQLNDQAKEIEKIVGVRSQLIQEVNAELQTHGIQVQADPNTGAIVFESSILFAKDSNELSENGKEFFEKFMPVYFGALLQEKFKQYVAEVIIEGHTDDSGTYLHNLELSQKRAWSVAEYFLNDECEFLSADAKQELKTLITVNGCADRVPVFQEDGTIDKDKSRRVEIKFRLKDQEMIQEMNQILNNIDN